MKIKVLLLIVLTIELMSCEKKEQSEIDKLISGVWILETTSNNYETIDFKEDMTYKMTGLVKNQLINNAFPIETGYITGKWNFANNEITFTSAQVELSSNNLNIDISTVDGKPIGSFYGYQIDGIFQDTSKIDKIIKIGGDTIVIGNEYVPRIWLIEELTNNSLIVKSMNETIKYKKN